MHHSGWTTHLGRSSWEFTWGKSCRNRNQQHFWGSMRHLAVHVFHLGTNTTWKRCKLFLLTQLSCGFFLSPPKQSKRIQFMFVFCFYVTFSLIFLLFFRAETGMSGQMIHTVHYFYREGLKLSILHDFSPTVCAVFVLFFFFKINKDNGRMYGFGFIHTLWSRHHFCCDLGKNHWILLRLCKNWSKKCAMAETCENTLTASVNWPFNTFNSGLLILKGTGLY